MLSPTYEITTALSHTDELISPPYDIAIVTISYGRVTKSPVWDTMMSKKNMGWPFYAAVRHCPVLTFFRHVCTMAICTIHSVKYTCDFVALCFVLVMFIVVNGFLGFIYQDSSGLHVFQWLWGNHIFSPCHLINIDGNGHYSDVMMSAMASHWAHRRLNCLAICLFRRTSKKTSKLGVTDLCEGNPPVTGGFPSQRASNVENVPFDDVIIGKADQYQTSA